jgi:hypothetical protein
LTKHESVFMAFCSRLVVSTTPFWQQNAVFSWVFIGCGYAALG